MKSLSVAVISFLQALALAAPVWEVIEERNSLPEGWIKHGSDPDSDAILSMKVHLKQQNEEIFEQKLLAVSLYLRKRIWAREYTYSSVSFLLEIQHIYRKSTDMNSDLYPRKSTIWRTYGHFLNQGYAQTDV